MEGEEFRWGVSAEELKESESGFAEGVAVPETEAEDLLRSKEQAAPTPYLWGFLARSGGRPHTR